MPSRNDLDLPILEFCVGPRRIGRKVYLRRRADLQTANAVALVILRSSTPSNTPEMMELSCWGKLRETFRWADLVQGT